MSIWWLIQSHAIGVIFAILHRNFPSEYYWYFSICKYCKSVSTEHRRTWFICAYAKHREPNTQLNAYRWKLMAPFENLVICHSVILCVHGEEKRAQLLTQYIHTHIWYRKIDTFMIQSNKRRPQYSWWVLEFSDGICRYYSTLAHRVWWNSPPGALAKRGSCMFKHAFVHCLANFECLTVWMLSIQSIRVLWRWLESCFRLKDKNDVL